MEVKTMKKLFMVLTLFIVVLCVLLIFVKYEPSMQIGFPEDAITRFGKGSIRGITYSPDGAQIAVSTHIGVWIYDARTGEELNLLTGQHGKPFVSAAYSSDGKTIATGGVDGTVQLWNTRTGKIIKTFKCPEEYIGYIKYSPDGQVIAIKGADDTIELWNARIGKHLKSLSEHEESNTLYEGHPVASITSFAFSPDGKTIVSGGGDKTVRLWNVHTGENIETLTGHTEEVIAVAYSPDGGTIVSASRDKTLRLWDTSTGENIKTLSGHKDIIVTVAYSPDGNIIVSGGWDGMLHRWNAQTGEPLKTYELYTGVLYFARGHAGAITHTAYSPDGKTIAAAGAGTMQWWDAHTGEKRKTFISHSPHSVKYSPDGRTLVIQIGKEVQLQDAATGKYLNTLKGNSYNIEHIIFSPNGDIIAITTVVGTLGLWDVSTGKKIRMLIRNVDTENFDPRANHFPVFSPDGKMIAIEQGKQTVGIWNTNTGEHVNTLTGHEGPLYLPVFSPNGKTIVTKTFVRFGKGGTVRLWNVDTGEKIMKYENPEDYPVFVYSPDSKTLTTNYTDNTVRLWDTTTGENINILKGHTDKVYTLMYGQDAKTLATHSKDMSVRLWDTTTGENIKTLKMLSGSNTDMTRSPDGDILAIVSNPWDKTVSLWNLTAGRPPTKFKKHSEGIFGWQPFKKSKNQWDHISWKIFSPTRDTLTVVMEHDKIRLWNLHRGKPIGKPIHLKDPHVSRSSQIGSAFYSPDGKMLATYPLSYKGYLRLWKASTGKLMRTFPWLTNLYAKGIKFSPDSRKIITEHTDGTVILWDISSR